MQVLLCERRWGDAHSLSPTSTTWICLLEDLCLLLGLVLQMAQAIRQSSLIREPISASVTDSILVPRTRVLVDSHGTNALSWQGHQRLQEHLSGVLARRCLRPRNACLVGCLPACPLCSHAPCWGTRNNRVTSLGGWDHEALINCSHSNAVK